MTDETIGRLADLCRQWGKDLLLTQASGGNISVKLGQRRMVIKASGGRLSEVTKTRGWALVDYRRFQQDAPSLWALRNPRAQESGYKDLLTAIRLSDPTARPSLETGMHALISDRWVAHVHSVAGQLVGLMHDGKTWAQEILGAHVKVKLVPPATPGYELTRTMAPLCKTPNSTSRPVTLWLLQNHGIAWSGPSSQVLLQAALRFETFARARFSLADYPPPRIQKRRLAWRLSFSHWPHCDFDFQPVIGDFVGHFGTPPHKTLRPIGPHTVEIRGEDPRKTEGHAQVFFGHALLSTIARREGWLKPLPRRIVKRLQDYSIE